MQTVLKNISDERLRASIVWLPILASDNRASAEQRSGEFADQRVTYFWDGDRLTGQAWQRALGLSGLAWDIYFLYGGQARWDTEPPIPDFWMHQLRAADNKAPFLNEPAFEVRVKEQLSKIESTEPPPGAGRRTNPPEAEVGTVKPNTPASTPEAKLAMTTIRVEGMTCGGCAVSVQQALAKREGVHSVEVSLEKKQAMVKYDPAKVTPEQLAEVINQTGFKAKL